MIRPRSCWYTPTGLAGSAATGNEVVDAASDGCSTFTQHFRAARAPNLDLLGVFAGFVDKSEYMIYAGYFGDGQGATQNSQRSEQAFV